MKTKSRIAIAALAALAAQAVCAAGTSYSESFDGLTDLPAEWSDGTITNIARGINVPSIGSAISAAASTKCLAVEGGAVYVNAFDAGNTYQVDFLLNVEEPSDELSVDDDRLADAQIAVAVGTNLTGNLLPVCVYAANGSGIPVWAETDATVTTGEWTRVSLLFDYTRDKCRVSVNGVPAAADVGRPTPSTGTGSGAWYPLVTSSSTITNVGYYGVACIDDVVVQNSEVEMPASASNSVEIAAGVQVSVPLTYLNEYGVSPSTFGTAKLDSTGLTVADKYIAGLDPTDGTCFEIKSVGMNGNELQVKVTGEAKNENWYQIVLVNPVNDAALATLAYNSTSDKWEWTIGETVSDAETSDSINEGSGETLISVTLPESVRGVSCKVRTMVVPAN